MNKNKVDRAGFALQLKEVITQLNEESRGLLRKIPTLNENFKEAEDIINGFIQDLEELPIVCLVGSTGMEKALSSTRILDMPVAATDAVFSKTKHSQSYFYPENKPICEFIDTRGLNEVFNKVDAEKQLIEDLTIRRPHLIVFVTDAASRAGVDRELLFLNQLLKKCLDIFHREVGCIIIANRCDGITPSGFTNLPAHEWNIAKENDTPRITEKRKNIIDKIAWLKKAVSEIGFSKVPEILPTAMMWQPEKRFWNREMVMSEFFRQSPTNILFAFGQIGQISENVNTTLELIAQEIIIKFSLISATICWNPFPVSDALVLIPIQTAMINAIKAMKLTGNLDATGIFKIVGLTSQGGKMLANFALKFLPGVGQAINSTVAASLTYGLGRIAIAHYIHGWGPEKLSTLINFAQFKADVDDLLANRLKK